MRTIIRTSLCALLLALPAAGCSKATPAGSDKSEPAIGTTGASAPSGDATAKAKEVFATHLRHQLGTEVIVPEYQSSHEV